MSLSSFLFKRFGLGFAACMIRSISIELYLCVSDLVDTFFKLLGC